jgi:hypothetical protein
VLAAAPARGQSAADLSNRILVDARLDDFTPIEAVFRNADNCKQVAPPESCGADEEPADDSAWSTLQDVQQIFVTWDATRLYVGARGRIAHHALLLCLDFQPGGLASMSELRNWRHALDFGAEMQPDAFLAVQDGATLPELWRVVGAEAVEQVSLDDYDAVASFAGEFPGGALEAAIPWEVLFPGAPVAVDPDTLAPTVPMFVLPADAAAHGLRLAAAVVHAESGLSGADVAPDGSVRPPLDPRLRMTVDRAARVDWDAAGSGPLHFVDFGAAVQTQAAARFVGGAPGGPVVHLEALRTFRAGSGEASTRLLSPDAGAVIAFGFDLASPVPAAVFVSARIVSLQGDLVRELYRDVSRTCETLPAPFGCFGDAERDRWDGRDANGRPVPGGVYVLQLRAGPSRGVESTRSQRTIAVVQ